MPADVPETPDEKRDREDQEKRSQRSTEESTVEALSRLSNLPEILALLTKMVAEQRQRPDTVKVTGRVVEDHPVVDVVDTITDEADEAEAEADGDDADVPPEAVMRDMSFADLKALATRLGVRTARGREEQLARLLEHTRG